MKKKVIIIGLILFSAFTILNINTSRNHTSFFDTILLDVEALATGGESTGESEAKKCGRAAYEFDDGTTNTTQCAKGCPDKKGTNIKYKDC